MAATREADLACAELRSRGIECDVVEPTAPWTTAAIVVGPEDVHRALDILEAWDAARTS